MVDSVWQDSDRHFDNDEVLGSLRDAFAGLRTGASVQPGQVAVDLPSGGGDVIYYPGVLAGKGLLGVSVSPFLTRLAEEGKNPVTDYLLVLSTETGLPLLLCDGLPLVTLRTGATSALAAQALARPETARIAVVGSGRIAQSHVRFLSHVFPAAAVSMWSPRLARQEHAQRRGEILGWFPQVGIAGTMEEAVAGADIIALCTSSTTPVVREEAGAEGCLTIAVGTDGPSAHEVAPGLLPKWDVYCDYRVTTPSVASEMVLATREGGWSASDIVADLGELVSGAVVPSVSGRRRYFRSMGLGIADLAMASLLIR